MHKRTWLGNAYPIIMSVGGTLMNIAFTLNDLMGWIDGIPNQTWILVGTALMVGSILIYAIRYQTEFNNLTPIVTISNYGIEKKSLSYMSGMLKHKENYAVIEFANNPKFRSSEAVARNVYAKVSYFQSDLTPLYQNIDGLWFPYKHEEPSDIQVRENGETELLPTGRKERLMIAQKHVGQNPPAIIENCKEYFSGFPFGSYDEYYVRHFLIDDTKYYVLVELFGTRLAEKYIFELWEEGDKLFFDQVKDKELCKKIILAKKN